MKYLVMVMVVLAVMVALLPVKPRRSASGDNDVCYRCHYIQAGLVNAYNLYVANPAAYAAPCVRGTYADCPYPSTRPKCNDYR